MVTAETANSLSYTPVFWLWLSNRYETEIRLLSRPVAMMAAGRAGPV